MTETHFFDRELAEYVNSFVKLVYCLSLFSEMKIVCEATTVLLISYHDKDP